MALFKSKQETLADNLYDEQIHGAVASEIAAGDLVPGLWAKSFAQADGNEQRAKAIYIKLRVEQIKLGNVAEAEREREAEKLRARAAPPPTQEQRMQQQEQQGKQRHPWWSLLVNLWLAAVAIYVALKWLGVTG